MNEPVVASVDAIRRFNRFYTERIGILDQRYLESEYSLTEVRVLYEVAHNTHASASDLAQRLRIDTGYLSRLVRRFEEEGLLARERSAQDARFVFLSLTAKGKRQIAALERRSRGAIAAMLSTLPATDQEEVVAALETAHRLLDREHLAAVVSLRAPEAGDLGWVVARHGALYAQEYGWDDRFEGLVAEIVGAFVAKRNPARERCWIAECDGRKAGAVFLVSESEEVARLRLLLVEPHARGAGIGTRLVDECERFARACGYRRIRLWTNSVLVAARRIYERAGYHLIEESPHMSFGHDLLGQTWELDLTTQRTRG